MQRKAAEIYKWYGALDDVTYAAPDLKANYRYATFVNIIDVSEEEVLVEVCSFRERTHYDEVMTKVCLKSTSKNSKLK